MKCIKGASDSSSSCSTTALAPAYMHQAKGTGSACACHLRMACSSPTHTFEARLFCKVHKIIQLLANAIQEALPQKASAHSFFIFAQKRSSCSRLHICVAHDCRLQRLTICPGSLFLASMCGQPGRDIEPAQEGRADAGAPQGNSGDLSEEDVWTRCQDSLPRLFLPIHGALYGGRHLVQGAVSVSKMYIYAS